MVRGGYWSIPAPVEMVFPGRAHRLKLCYPFSGQRKQNLVPKAKAPGKEPQWLVLFVSSTQIFSPQILGKSRRSLLLACWLSNTRGLQNIAPDFICWALKNEEVNKWLPKLPQGWEPCCAGEDFVGFSFCFVFVFFFFLINKM